MKYFIGDLHLNFLRGSNFGPFWFCITSTLLADQVDLKNGSSYKNWYMLYKKCRQY